jgi:hypothetical protein
MEQPSETEAVDGGVPAENSSCREGTYARPPLPTRAQLLAAPFGPLYIRAAGKRSEIRFAGYHNVHMGLAPLDRAAYFSNKLPGCDLRLNKLYLVNLKDLYYRSDAEHAALVINLRQRSVTIVHGEVKSRPTPYTFRLEANSVVIQRYRADLGLVFMAGLADASSAFAMFLLHSPPGAPEKIMFELSQMKPFFTPRCLHAAIAILAAYSVMRKKNLDDSLQWNFRCHLRQASSVVAAYLWASGRDMAVDLQRTIDSTNIATACRTFPTSSSDSAYAGAIQGCIMGGALKYARGTTGRYEDKRDRIKLLIEFALGGARSAPIWGFVFAMPAPVVDRLAYYLAVARDSGELLSALKQHGYFMNIDADQGEGPFDMYSFYEMMVIALEQSSRAD